MNIPLAAINRDALYYPSIQIHDVNWLKATLLAFPQVRRMVPRAPVHRFTEIREFCRELEGPRKEPLLVDEATDSPAVYSAQLRLLEVLKSEDGVDLDRFTREMTVRQFRRVRPMPSGSTEARWARFSAYFEERSWPGRVIRRRLRSMNGSPCILTWVGH